MLAADSAACFSHASHMLVMILGKVEGTASPTQGGSRVGLRHVAGAGSRNDSADSATIQHSHTWTTKRVEKQWPKPAIAALM